MPLAEALVGHGGDDRVVIVGRVDVRAGLDDLVDAIERGIVGRDLGGFQEIVQLGGCARADEDSAHRRVRADERHSEVRDGDAETVRDLSELPDGPHLALVGRVVQVEDVLLPRRPGLHVRGWRQPFRLRFRR
jgi:hypothetical protein